MHDIPWLALLAIFHDLACAVALVAIVFLLRPQAEYYKHQNKGS